MTDQMKEHLEGLSTRELLVYLKFARRFYGWYCPWDHKYDNVYTSEEIKTELAKREHIPNKKEGKALRREAARRKR